MPRLDSPGQLPGRCASVISCIFMATAMCTASSALFVASFVTLGIDAWLRKYFS